jgi:hypothetical protein
MQKIIQWNLQPWTILWKIMHYPESSFVEMFYSWISLIYGWMLDTILWKIKFGLHMTVCPILLFALNICLWLLHIVWIFCLYVITWWNTIATFSVVWTISKENIYVSILMQMLNRMNFGIGNYFYKLPCGGKVLFCRTLYSPTMRRNLVIVIYWNFWHTIWKMKIGKIVQLKIVHYRI